mmetsp:Transcript_112149/g.229600  ORF Transcript_112149/g.229600 Transcript_112149/m.229600 type:complete len:363 (+) Transcript_112149:1950-3038(+)
MLKVLVVHAIVLGLQVSVVVGVCCGDHHGDGTVDLDPKLLQFFHLARVVRHELDGTNFHVMENRWDGSVVTAILGETKVGIGIHGVQSDVLHGVRGDFVGKTDSASFLLQVHNGSTALGNLLQSHFQLLATVASFATENLRRKALIVDTNRNVLVELSLDPKGRLVGGVNNRGFPADVFVGAFDQGRSVGSQPELTNIGGQGGLGDEFGGNRSILNLGQFGNSASGNVAVGVREAVLFVTVAVGYFLGRHAGGGQSGLCRDADLLYGFGRRSSVRSLFLLCGFFSHEPIQRCAAERKVLAAIDGPRFSPSNREKGGRMWNQSLGGAKGHHQGKGQSAQLPPSMGVVSVGIVHYPLVVTSILR